MSGDDPIGGELSSSSPSSSFLLLDVLTVCLFWMRPASQPASQPAAFISACRD
jgi:hypothetical protein